MRSIYRLIMSAIVLILLFDSVSAIEGFTVMSVSRPDIISPKEDLSGKWWLITISANGGGQSVVGTITPEELKQKTGGWGSKFPLAVRLISKKEIIYYPLNTGENPVYTYDMGIITGGWVLGDAPGCGEGTYRDINIHRGGWPHKVFKRLCIIKNQNGKTGYLDSPTTKFMADIELTVQNNIISKEISSDDQSIYFNSQAQASWQGSLVTGTEPPNSASFIPTWKRDSNRWKLAQISTLDEYKNELTNIESFIVNNKDPRWDAESETRNRINTMNNATNRLLEEETEGFSANEGGFSYETTGKFITNPVITFKIRADWIGITIPFGIPKIISKENSIQWKSNEKGLINLSIMNIGDADGHFLTSIENCNFNQSSVLSPIDASPGNTVNITLTIDTDNIANNMTEQCLIRVYDKNHPEYNDTVSYSLSVTKVVPMLPPILKPINIIGASSSPVCRTVGFLTTASSILGFSIPGIIGSIITKTSQICSI